MAQAQQGPFTTFNSMLASHMAYTNLAYDMQEAFFRACAGFKHTPTEPLKDCPGDITVLGRALQAALSVATAITVSRSYGPNEELGIELLHSTFDGDVLSLAHTALAATPPSDGVDGHSLFGFSTYNVSLPSLLSIQCVIAELTKSRTSCVHPSARDGHSLFGFSTYNVSLPSLLRLKRTMSRGSIHPHGAISSRSWRMRRNSRPHRDGSYWCFIPRMPATSPRGPL
jgi:hypothetical protein